MLKPIYRGCSACMGSGSVEVHSLPASSTSKVSYPTVIECEACQGKGYFPTGDFTYEPDPRNDFLEDLEHHSDLSVFDKNTIKSRF